MRIIAGQYGRRKLEVPKNADIRPTSDKIRGAIFNSLGAIGAIEDASVLDAYSGTGALGLEALSRGAKHATFIDKSKTSLELTRRNIESLGSCTESETRRGDASRMSFNGAKFDLIFLDPPYHKNLINLTLNNLLKQSACASTCYIICESEKDSPAIQTVQTDAFTCINERSYGDTLIRILLFENDKAAIDSDE